MYCVYWISRPEHYDPHTQGYIGITKDIKERLRSHKKNKNKSRFTDAIKSIGFDNLCVIVLHKDLVLKEALDLERYYRPHQNIGWNMQQGGNLGVESVWYCIDENRRKHSEATSIATRAAIAAKDTYEKRSERAKQSWLKTRDIRTAAVAGERNPRAQLTSFDVIQIKQILHLYNNKEIADLYDVKPHVISFIRTGKNWSHI